ncbi:beta-lactamase family protein [Streptomyces canus]|uniref:serine hydrolase domain-containing protein n=1 Tax=Streptomyces canus TaxID=58343 RepID=UPI0030E58BB1
MSASGPAESPDFPRTRRVLEEGVELGWHSATLLSVRTADGPVTDMAIGRTLDGVAATGKHLAPLFCAAKPLLVVALARLVTQERLSWEDPVARFVPEFGRHGTSGATLRHLLDHSIGLSADPVEIIGLRWAAALRAICRTPAHPGWTAGVEHAYLPFTSWYLMGEVLTRVSGVPLAEFLRREVLGPLGLRHTYVGMSTEEFERTRPVLAGVGSRQVRGDPAAHLFRLPVDGPDVCGDVGPASARSTMADLARLYAVIGLRPHPPVGVGEDVWAEVTAPPNSAVFDQRHKVWTRLGMGVVFEGRQLGEGSRVFGPECSPDTRGHRGLGSIVAYADPRTGIAVAMFFDITNEALMNRARIDRTSAAVYQDWLDGNRHG